MDLIDTNLVSELRKVRSGEADPGVAAWADGVDASSLFLSSITLHELELGVLLAERRDPTQGALLRHWLQQAVVPAFAGRLLAVDAAVALRSAALHGPDPKPFRDGLIAATALVHSLVVVTRNLADFEATGVPLLNPWQQGEA
jgi:predicted nucleic acid-binding protein